MRLAAKVFYCPKCRTQLETKEWAGPMCPKGCNKQMKRVTAGREGVFVKP